MKKCTKCGETKPLAEFHKNKNGKNGRRSDCKACSLLRVRRHQQENEAHYKKYRKQYYQENEAHLKKYQKQYYQENKEYKQQTYQENREYIQQAYQEKNTKQIACVYQIKNLVNGRLYIGETLRGKIRWQQHLNALRRNYHVNPRLQEDFNQFGENNFEWSIIQQLSKDKEVLQQEEKNTIQKLLAEGKELYNALKNLEDK
jgi:hypothetical protein